MGMKLLKVKYHLAAAFRILLFKVLFGSRLKIGKRTTFRRFFNIYLGESGTIQIGQRCFFNHGCSINALSDIRIGDDCIFGENVKIYDHNHRFASNTDKVKEQGFSVKPVTIGKECWIGSNVVLLKGASIGNNCVVGAGCIISEEIPDNTLVTASRQNHYEKILRK